MKEGAWTWIAPIVLIVKSSKVIRSAIGGSYPLSPSRCDSWASCSSMTQMEASASETSLSPCSTSASSLGTLQDLQDLCKSLSTSSSARRQFVHSCLVRPQRVHHDLIAPLLGTVDRYFEAEEVQEQEANRALYAARILRNAAADEEQGQLLILCVPRLPPTPYTERRSTSGHVITPADSGRYILLPSPMSPSQLCASRTQCAARLVATDQLCLDAEQLR